MKPVKSLSLNGNDYAIQAHDFDSGGEIAFDLNRRVRAHAIRSQKVTMRALDDLTDEQKKAIESAETDEARAAAWVEIVAPKIDKAGLADAAADFLESLDSKHMMDLFKRLVAFTHAGGKCLDDDKHRQSVMAGRYKDMVPLMRAIIDHNDFFDLDASEILQIQAQ